MKTFRLILVAAVLAAAPAWAKPKGCLTPREEVAEQVVRHGVRLREAAQRCEDLGYSSGTIERWHALDAQLGEQFAAQTALRARAFQREFGEAAERELRHWDGRIVSHFRHRPLSEMHCARMESLLVEAGARGWPGFRRQAERERGEVRMAYRVCG